jgi:hypothetical protein
MLGARSQTDGRFVIRGVEPGTYELRAEHPQRAPAKADEPIVVEGSDIDGLELRLDAGTELQGRILGLGFDELARVRVGAYRLIPTGSGEGPLQPEGDAHEGVSSFEGVFRIPNIPVPAQGQATWSVFAILEPSGRLVEERVTLRPSSRLDPPSVELDFDRGLSLHGRIVDADAPVAGARVVVEGQEHGNQGLVVTDDEGRFQITNLPAGAYVMVFVRTDAQLIHALPVDVVEGREPLVLRFDSRPLEGWVVDRTGGAPVPGATVEIHPAGGREHGTHYPPTPVDDTGRFQLRVTEGEGSILRVVAPGYATADLPVAPAGGGPVTVELERLATPAAP